LPHRGKNGIEWPCPMEKEKESPFSRKLLDWYHANKRDLPWRRTRDPYRIWVSEIMLQQTTVAAVIPYYERWLKIYPDIERLSKAPLAQVLKTWQGLGYYQRARNMHKAAGIIAREYRGRIPADYDTLVALPGFGPYTAAAVLSIAYDLPYPVLDANVRRILMRLMGMKKHADPGHDRILMAFLLPYLPEDHMGDFNQALMELGALVCRSRNPACLLCPLLPRCDAFRKGEQEIIPMPRNRRYHRLDAVIALIREEDGRYLIQKRPPRGLLAGLWEFPGGKREKGETLEEALRREMKEELGVDVESASPLITVSHAYTKYQVKLHAFACRLTRRPHLKPDNQRWAGLKELESLPVPSGTAKIIRYLEEREGAGSAQKENGGS
jgi:A/G-specific adenine glycosylase